MKDSPNDKIAPLLLTPADVCRLLSIGLTMCYAMINSGDIPSIRIGKLIRIPADKLAEWVKSQT